MKTALLVVLLAAPRLAAATPYFRFAALTPSPVGGALLAPESLKESEAAGLYPVFSHSTRDGCLFPAIICEDWSPLAVGASVHAGDWSFVAGPIFNVLPWVQSLALKLLPDRYERTRAFFEAGPQKEHGAVTFSAGPMWEYKSATNKGYYRTFTGAALHF